MLLLWTFVTGLLLVSGTHSRRGNRFAQIQQPTRDNFTNVGYTRPPPSRVGGFEEVYRWRQITFAPLQQDAIIFGLPDKRVNDLTSTEILDNFIQFNNLPMGATHHKNRIFITLPRRRPGVPATLAFISSTGSRESSPSLQAYPDFRTNELHPQNQPDRNRIVSVYRTRVDRCDRLWFVDTGNLEYPNNPIQSIWIFKNIKNMEKSCQLRYVYLRWYLWRNSIPVDCK